MNLHKAMPGLGEHKRMYAVQSPTHSSHHVQTSNHNIASRPCTTPGVQVNSSSPRCSSARPGQPSPLARTGWSAGLSRQGPPGSRPPAPRSTPAHPPGLTRHWTVRRPCRALVSARARVYDKGKGEGVQPHLLTKGLAGLGPWQRGTPKAGGCSSCPARVCMALGTAGTWW